MKEFSKPWRTSRAEQAKLTACRKVWRIYRRDSAKSRRKGPKTGAQSVVGQSMKAIAGLADTKSGLTPYEFICKAWTSQPQRFKLNPLQQMPGPNI